MSASKFQVTVFTRQVESKWAKIIPLDRIKRITTYFATDTIGQLKYMNSVPQRMSGPHSVTSVKYASANQNYFRLSCLLCINFACFKDDNKHLMTGPEGNSGGCF